MIDIVIVTYNRLPYLQKCVWSILASTTVDYRLFVIDDCSTDGVTAEWLVGMRNAKKIHAIELNKKNQGTDYCFNTIIAATEGDWFVMCNDDMWFHRGWYEECIRIREKHSDCAIVSFYDYSRLELDDGVEDLGDELRVLRTGLGASIVKRKYFKLASGFNIPTGKKMGFMATPFCARVNNGGGRIYAPKQAGVTNMDVLGCPLNEFQHADESGYFDHRVKEKGFKSKNRKKYDHT